MKILSSAIILFCFYSSALSQDSIKELESALNDPNNTQKIKTLHKLVSALEKSDPDKALEYADQALNFPSVTIEKTLLVEIAMSAGDIATDKNADRRAEEYFKRALRLANPQLDKKNIASTNLKLGSLLKSLDKNEEAINYYKNALTLRTELGDKSGAATSLRGMGGAYHNLGMYSDALKAYNEAETMFRALGDMKGVGSALENKGRVYRNMGYYAESLNSHLKSIQIKEDNGDKRGLATSTNNIAIVYRSLGENEIALDYYMKSLDLIIELGLTKGSSMSRRLNNIGMVYGELGDYEKGLIYLNDALKLDNEIGNLSGKATRLSGIGSIYTRQKKYSRAIEEFEKALEIREATRDPRGKADALNNIGNAHLGLKEFSKAKDSFEASLSLSLQMDAKSLTLENYAGLQQLYEQKDDFTNAYKYSQLQSKIKDNILKEEKNTAIAVIRSQSEFAKKEREILREKDALQSTIINILLIGLFGLVVMGVVINRQRKAKFKSNELIKNVINSLTHPLYVINADSNEIELANTAGSNALARDKNNTTQTGSKSGSALPIITEEIIKAKKPLIKEHKFEGPNGQTYHYEVHGFPILDRKGIVKKVIEYRFDISKRKQTEEEKKILQEQLFHSQKMESIGRLAGGIAHDFNNLLSVIMTYADILKIRFHNVAPKAKSALNAIFDAVQRGSDLSNQILGFAKKGDHTPVPLNVNEIIKNTLAFSEKAFCKNIKVKLSFDSALKNILADKHQIEQVLTNIIINASEAMPESGELTITTENLPVNVAFLKHYPELAEKSYIKITIKDTGNGIPPEIKNDIFEPFFTTKKNGTGLGLATAYGIVEKNNGKIYCDSAPGEGATFTIYFPTTKLKPEAVNNGTDQFVKGKGCILVVDDEENVREALASVLQHFGYSTIVAEDGVKALKIYKEQSDKIDMILLDMIMPNMDGEETFDKLRKLNPDIKVLLLSGFSKDTKVANSLKNGVKGYLQKPFNSYELSVALSETLNYGQSAMKHASEKSSTS